MKKILSILLTTLAIGTATAQTPVEGLTYFLPKTSLRVHLLIEKRAFTPGRLAAYAERYMKLPCQMEPETTYHVVGVDIEAVGVPDSAKQYEVPLTKKHTIFKLERDANGVLTAVNTTGPAAVRRVPFKAAPKPKPLNEADYMDEEILAATSSAKMAALIAQEIYDIRDARNQLTRGEAETMPTDGAQMKLMMQGLDQQETALLQVFKGTTVIDTTETTIAFTPTEATEGQLLFRLSKYLGMTDNDDLGGSPYYISVEDEHVIPTLDAQAVAANDKGKEEAFIHVALPGKIKVTVSDEKGKRLQQAELYAAQFGRTEALSNELFGKKQTCHIKLNAVTGNVDELVIEPLR